MSKLIQPMGLLGPKSDLVPTDGRKSIRKKKAGPKAKTNTNLLSTLIDNDVNVANVGKSITVTDGEFGFKAKSLTDGVGNAAGKNVKGVFGANPRTQAQAGLNLIGMLGNSQVTELSNDAGQVLKYSGKGNANSATGLARMVGNFAKVNTFSNFIDSNSTLALGMELLGQASELGVFDLIDDIMAKIKADKLAKQRLINSVRSVIARSDLNTLEKIMKWIKPEGVMARVPDAILMLLTVFRLPPGTPPTADLNPIRDQYLRILNALNPTWTTIDVGGVTYRNYAPFTRVSKDAARVLTYVPIGATPGPEIDLYLDLVTTGPLYRPVAAEQALKKARPVLDLLQF